MTAIRTLQDSISTKSVLVSLKLNNNFGHHLQTGPGPRPRPSKNRILILRTSEKTGPRNLIETKDQIEYILRYSNFVKKRPEFEYSEKSWIF